MGNESRLELLDGRARQLLATGVSGVPLIWLVMFRLRDLVPSRSPRFTTDWESAHARLDDPRGLRSMFASYGDISQHAAKLSETLTAQVRARGIAPAAARVSLHVGEIAGEHPDPREWARALGAALDAFDDSSLSAAPMTPLPTIAGGLTEIEKVRRLRSSADLGIGDARALLGEHHGDLPAALAAIEASKTSEQRARDKAGAFVASLVQPQPLQQRPPWQVLFEASGLDYGQPFPAAGLLLQTSSPAQSDLRTHTRLLGESATVGAVSWEPGYLWA